MEALNYRPELWKGISMKKKRGIYLMVGFILLCLTYACTEEAPRIPQGQPTPTPDGEEWLDLFSVDNAGYWENVTDEKADIFKIENGVFHVPGQESTRYIAWQKESFGDFELHIEFKVPKDANSGVFIRTDPADPVQRGMEIQVVGDYSAAPSIHSGGALYDIATPMFNMALPAGAWNSYDIRFQGDTLDVVYNGWKVLSLDISLMTQPLGKFDTPLASLPREGHIILQDHGDEVTYRNLKIRRIQK